VKLGTGIARTSGADGGYYDGTASSTSVTAGTSQTISFSAGFTGSAYTEYWKIFIDYNQDGDFTDSGETVVSGSSSSSGTLSATFTVPTTAKTGKTRLRLIMSDNSGTTSCGSYSYGETEDYSLSITGGTAIAAASHSADAGLAAATTSAISGDARLEVFPNPATDHIQLSLTSGASLTSVTVVDARGAKVAAHYDGGQLDVSGLSSGLYTLLVSDGTHSFTQHFVKQ